MDIKPPAVPESKPEESSTPESSMDSISAPVTETHVPIVEPTSETPTHDTIPETPASMPTPAPVNEPVTIPTPVETTAPVVATPAPPSAGKGSKIALIIVATAIISALIGGLVVYALQSNKKAETTTSTNQQITDLTAQNAALTQENKTLTDSNNALKAQVAKLSTTPSPTPTPSPTVTPKPTVTPVK